jgi:hypothetical protein
MGVGGSDRGSERRLSNHLLLPAPETTETINGSTSRDELWRSWCRLDQHEGIMRCVLAALTQACGALRPVRGQQPGHRKP